MDTQVTHLYQRAPQEQGPSGRQRSNNGSDGGSPRNNSGQRWKIVLLIAGIVLVFWASLSSWLKAHMSLDNLSESSLIVRSISKFKRAMSRMPPSRDRILLVTSRTLSP